MSAYSENVADMKDMNRNSNTNATLLKQCNTINYKINVACCASISDMRKSIFDVGTDVLDIAMRTFTMLAQIQQGHMRGGFVSIPVASWETACLAHGCTHEQFEKGMAYCNALNVYREENETLVLET